MSLKGTIKWLVALLLMFSAGLAGPIACRVWPRALPPQQGTKFPQVLVENGRLVVTLPAAALVADVGTSKNLLDAYMHFDELRSQEGVEPSRVFVCWSETRPQPLYRLFLVVDNDLLTAGPYLSSLAANASVPQFELNAWTKEDLARCGEQTNQFVAVFHSPARYTLEEIDPAELISPMAHFLVFKSATDRRVRQRTLPDPPVLNLAQATELAADMVVVAKFYGLPLDYFLGIGAVENNYMNVTGDLDHAVWKRQPRKGDIVLKRRRGRVLVRNYSVGVWQITRETLRYAHSLYLKERRDYDALPERLRPDRNLDLDSVKFETLTTYAGLLFRDLLDHFDGDVAKAVGAYNGGEQNPKLEYAAAVTRVALYARQLIEHAVALERASLKSRRRGEHSGSPGVLLPALTPAGSSARTRSPASRSTR